VKTAWCGLIVAATVLAGCARDEAIEIVEDNAPDTCGADLFPLGIHIDDAGDAERSAETRVIRPGDAVTADFSAARLNLVVDGDGLLTEAYCG